MALTLRSTKGSALTHDEADANFSGLAAGTLIDVSGIEFEQSAGAIARTVEAKLRDQVSILDYGAVDRGDIAAAFNLIKADYPNGCTISIPATDNYWLLNSTITTSDSAPYIIKCAGRTAQIRKNFNGDLINLGAKSALIDAYIHGMDGTFTGRGIVISSGDLDINSWRLIENCDITQCESYAVEFTQNKAGYGSFITNCRMYNSVDPSQPQIKLPSGETNGNRHFTDIFTFGSVFADFAGTNNLQVVGCSGAIPSFGTDSNKISITGSRFFNSGDGLVTTLQPKGTAHAICGNTISVSAITFDVSLASFKWKGNSVSSGTTITDNATGTSNANDIDIDQRIGTPTWTSSGTAPSLGAGQISSAYTRSGERCKFNMFLIAASDTTFGTGVWAFSLPYSCPRGITGTCLMRDSSTGAEYAGVALIEAASTVKILATGNTTKAGAAIPFTWADADRFYLDIEYPIT